MGSKAPHEMYDPTGLEFIRVARRYKLSEDGLRFVYDALAFAPRLLPDYPAKGTIRGQKLCEAIARFAIEWFGADAAETLAEWKLDTGRNVGQYAVVMCKEGLMDASREDSITDFEEIGIILESIHRVES
ncbi:MAG: hypothetical protein KF873_23735 [Gemmataceae bacterium]|nr:hypothetical protein [Gemmataceae bacterium]